MVDEQRDVQALRGWQIPAYRVLHTLLALPFNVRHNLRTKVQARAIGERPRHQLKQYERNVMSQQGEDGILREIFYRIGPGRRFFIEFGVEDGSVCNTALMASRYGWGGLYIEADSARIPGLRERWAGRHDIKVRQAFITAENIAGIFEEAGVPDEPDLLSIDIDGNDYWVWKALAKYRPRVVVIEYNAAYPPPRRWIMAYNPDHRWDWTTHFGASLSAMTDLGSRLGYALVGTDTHGVNAFFIRRDLLAESGLREVTPEESYHPPRYGILRSPWPYRAGDFVSRD
ncbi:MAG TPA: hypothetical protein VFE35_07275 [Candidatus Cybelea sp.]|jgi:hypothetical protein|nr:hypothetical protein [Candidatus Cybelea sp.]